MSYLDTEFFILKLLEVVRKYSFIYLVQLFGIPWTVAHQAPLSVEFFRQNPGVGLPFPSPGSLPDVRIEHGSPALQADSFLPASPGKSTVDQILLGNGVTEPGFGTQEGHTLSSVHL